MPGETVGVDLPRHHTHKLEGRTALVVGTGMLGTHGEHWLRRSLAPGAGRCPRDPLRPRRRPGCSGRPRHQRPQGAATAIAGDALDADGCRRVIDRAAANGEPAIVITTVSRGDFEGILDFDVAPWTAMLVADRTSARNVTAAADGALRPGGAVVTTSSGTAAARGSGIPYSIAKAGLEQLTADAAATRVPRGIRMNSVSVGTIWSSSAARTFDETVRGARAAAVPPATEGTAWEIADAMVFLASTRARWITGQILAGPEGGPADVPPGHSSPVRGDGGLG